MFDYCEIALVDLLIKSSKGVSVSDLRVISEDEAWKAYCEMQNFPKPGSIWFNNRQQKNYTVLGVVSICAEEDDWEVLYRDEDWAEGQYRRRSIDEWYGVNRDGLPRFVEQNFQTSPTREN